MECEVEGCDKKAISHGLCNIHRMRLRRHGHLKKTRPSDWGLREKHPLYNTWMWMRRMRHKASICSQWEDFWAFVEDIGERPSRYFQLYRLDKGNGYNPKNCIWKEVIPCKDRAKYARDWRNQNPDKAKNSCLKKSHGITIEDYKQMYKDQNGVCAICGNPETSKYYSLAVDHCHKTNKIRGLLCQKCNRGLGFFGDSPETLQSAINYLTN